MLFHQVEKNNYIHYMEEKNVCSPAYPSPIILSNRDLLFMYNDTFFLYWMLDIFTVVGFL